LSRIRITYFGWLAPDGFHLSLYPADAPVRPNLTLDSIEEVREFARRKRADVLWHPPLPDEIARHARQS
jgi:hypothetical protein